MDLYIFQIINQFAGRWDFLDWLAVFFARYFEYVVIIGVFIIFWKKWKIILQVFGGAILARLVIANIIRWILPRVRPFVELNLTPLISQNPVESSFPSGHAAFYFAIATVIYFYNKKAGILFLIAASLISIARVFTGLHWPSDILVGAAVGILSAFIIKKGAKLLLK